jgi:hypothetical protein
MSRAKHHFLWALFLAALVVWCRLADHRYQMQCESFPIESCVTVDLARGEIAYVLADRCLLVVKAFKAGRLSAMALKPKVEP